MGLDGVFICTIVFGLLKEGCPSAISIYVPDRVPAVLGSCVVIPCYFTIPTDRHTEEQPIKYHVRLRFPFLFGKRTAFSSDKATQVYRHFRGRTALVGDPTEGDCSVRIEKLRMDDRNHYEVELKEREAHEWKVSKPILITVSDTPSTPVISDPGTIIEGQLVSLNCTVNNSCPEKPPHVHWRWERGDSSWHQEQRQVLQSHGQIQVLLTSLSFNASHITPPWVTCLATYPGMSAASAVKKLNIKFPPRDIAIEVLTQVVHEGESALLSCSCKADPPVSTYQWFYTHQGHTIALPHRQQTVRVYNVIREKRFHCTAQNQIGWAESTPTAINVQSKPIISQRSSCQWKEEIIHCQCVVDSNPRSAVTWSVNGSSSVDGYNTSVLAQGNLLVAVLSGDVGLPLSIACYAHNFLGNDSVILLDRSGDSPLLWKVVFVTSIFLSFFLLIFLLIHFSRKTRRHILNHKHPSVQQGSLEVYHGHTPLYINCTEVTHIYTNGSYQLVYQNCTPVFIQNKQRHQRERLVTWPDNKPSEMQSPRNDAEAAIYLEII